MSNPVTDPREMRKLLREAAYRGSRIDGRDRMTGISLAGSIARNVMYEAEHLGYSGEDAMTLLAYRALMGYENATDRLVDWVNVTPSPQVVFAVAAPGEQEAFEAWCPYSGSPDPRVVWAAAWRAAGARKVIKPLEESTQVRSAQVVHSGPSS